MSLQEKGSGTEVWTESKIKIYANCSNGTVVINDEPMKVETFFDRFKKASKIDLPSTESETKFSRPAPAPALLCVRKKEISRDPELTTPKQL